MNNRGFQEKKKNEKVWLRGEYIVYVVQMPAHWVLAHVWVLKCVWLS